MNASDLIFLVFLGVSAVLLVLGREAVDHWRIRLAAHLALMALVGSLRFVPLHGWGFFRFIRHTYLLWLFPIAYAEVGLLNRVVLDRYFDDVVLRWDAWVFGGHPHLYLRTLFPSRPLSEFLHFSYAVYLGLVPTLGLTLWFQRRHEAFRVFASTIALTMYSCYLIFLFFPVQGPYYTFPPGDPTDGFFRTIVTQTMLKGAAVGTAFPSSHVAGSITVAVMAHWFSRKLSYALIVLAVGIALATVYGGFHYAIDALAGLVFGLTLALVGPRLHSAQLRIARLPFLRLRFPHIRFRRVGGRFRGVVMRPPDAGLDAGPAGRLDRVRVSGDRSPAGRGARQAGPGASA